MDYRRQRAGSMLAALWILLAAVSTQGQTVTADLPAGAVPRAVAVNPVSNIIYVANAGPETTAGSITVIDGATNSTATVTDPNANTPWALAVNPVTNTIYVVNYVSDNVTVVDGATNAISTVSVGTTPVRVAVNPITNMVYVVNKGSSNVTVINGTSYSTTTVADPNASGPVAVAVNPVTNEIYVANGASNNITVIDGNTNSTTTVTDPTAIGPIAVSVDPVRNRIYVANQGAPETDAGAGVTVINGATNSVIASVSAGSFPSDVAVNPVTNKIYVTNQSSDNVTVIDGGTNTVTATVTVGALANAVAFNPVTNKIYVASPGDNYVTLIDGATNSATTLTDPKAVGPGEVAVNPVTDKIYVANLDSANVTVIDGATNLTTPLPVGLSPRSVAVNPVSGEAYVANYDSGNVSVIYGGTPAVEDNTVPAGTNPRAVAVNPATNQIYVANSGSNNVTVIDANNNKSTTTVTDPNANTPWALAVNPVTNMIYVANQFSNNVTVIESNTVIATVPTGTYPYAVAVNPVTNQIYVADQGSSSVTVIDGATNNTSTVPVGSGPNALAVNPVTNQIYVANSGVESSNVTVIDGVTNATTTITDPTASEPRAVAVNPVTNMVYVVNFLSSSVTLIAGATSSSPASYFATLPTGNGPDAVAVNPVSNKIYVANELSNSVTVIDGATGTTTTVTDTTAGAPYALDVDPVLNNIYVVNNGSGTVTAIAEQQVQTIPIFTSITPLPGNQTTIQTPTFSFTATDTLLASSSFIDNLVFELGTWQSPWQAATPNPAAMPLRAATRRILKLTPQQASGPGYSGTTPALQPGFDILYAYATDGEEATSTNTGQQSSPLIGNIAAYGFLVAAPEAFITPNSLTFAGQAVATPSASQPVTLTNNGGAPLTIASVAFAGTNSSDFSESDNCVSSSPIAPAGTCTINVTFTPTAVGTRTATLVVTDNSGDINGSEHSINLTGTGTQDTPVITSLSPNAATAGGAAFTLTVNGTGFVTGAAVDWNGTALSNPQYLNATQLTAQVPANLIATAGTAMVTVVENGATSNSSTFTIAAGPVISSLSPPGATAGGAAFTLTVNGTGFVTGAAVDWNSTPLSNPQYVSATQLTAQVPANLIAATGTAAVTVVENGVTSNSSTFTIAAGPVISSLSPPGATAGGAAFTLTVNGTGFVTGAAVDWNGTALSNPQYVNATQLTAQVPANLIATAGTAVVTVVENGATSPNATFAIQAPALSGVSLTLMPNTTMPSQPSIAITLSAPASAPLTGTLSLSFTPDASVTNWNSSYTNAQFVSGCSGQQSAPFVNPCTTTFTIGSQGSSSNTTATVPLQVGTVAGTITVTLTNASQNGASVVLQPAPAPVKIPVSAAQPQIVGSVGFTISPFSVTLTGASNTLELQSATFVFTGADGTTFTGSTQAPPIITPASDYFMKNSPAVGGSFMLTQQFSFSGDTSALQGATVTVTLQNTAGSASATSPAAQ